MIVNAMKLDPVWLRSSFLQKLLALLNSAGRVWVVGGAVRDTLMGFPVKDVDLATTVEPKTVVELVTAAGMRSVPTGLDHGTVTVLVDGSPFEVTTLRQDVWTDGRRAGVVFTDSLMKDALRRDFTINALYMSASGEVIDLVGGVKDCLENRVCFIGIPEMRIREDYLRILRFFRFSATYGATVNADGCRACVKLRDKLHKLSAERIANELAKLLTTSYAMPVLEVMNRIGILDIVLGVNVTLTVLKRLYTISDMNNIRRDESKMLLWAAIVNELVKAREIATRLHFSKRETSDMINVLMAADSIKTDTLIALLSGEREPYFLKYRFNIGCAKSALLLAAARAGLYHKFTSLFTRMESFIVPSMPVCASDLLALGFCSGPELGLTLNEAEKYWIATNFRAKKTEILKALGLLVDSGDIVRSD